MSAPIRDTESNAGHEEHREKCLGRLLIFIVAYNAEKTIEAVLKRIPAALSDMYEVEILIIDDSSQDQTFAKSELIRRSGTIPFAMNVLFNPVNQGYGGNQKIGFHYALRHGFDWVALLHGDGQYAPECMPELVEPLARGTADAVFGSRMMLGMSALKGGMPLYKFVGNKILTRFQNILLGSSLSEFHSGYRIYAASALGRIPFDLNSNDFHFDTEIIIQLIMARLKIMELPIPTFYGDEICHVNGLKYAWDVCRTTMQAKVQRLHIFYDRKFDCRPEGDVATRNAASPLFSDTFLARLQSAADVVVVGEADDAFLTTLSARGHRVTSLPNGLLGAKTDSIGEADYLLIVDDLEISQHPDAFMEKLREYCRYRPNTVILVVVGNIGFCLTRMMLLFGRFSYSRKGIISFGHARFFTLRSLKKIFTQYWFECREMSGLPIQYNVVFRSRSIAALMTAVHRVLIRIRPSLFGYQLLGSFRPRPSLDYLLEHAIHMSREKSKAL